MVAFPGGGGGVVGISSDGDDRMEWLSAKILAILRLSVNFFQVRLTKCNSYQRKIKVLAVRKIQTHRHSLDIYSLTHAVSQFTRTSARKEQNSTNISKTTCQKLASEKRSLNNINYHNSNTPT